MEVPYNINDVETFAEKAYENFFQRSSLSKLELN